MTDRRRYQRRQDAVVHAICLDLDTDGFTYRKWGGEQRASKGDWLIDNGEDVYTVDADRFARTYVHVQGAEYRKIGYVWAIAASTAGSVPTKEGATGFEAGDYLVSTDEEGTDSFAVGKTKFEQMYELAE